MTAERESRSVQRKEGTVRSKREHLESGSRKEEGSSRKDPGSVFADPWGALFEQLLEPPAEDGVVDKGPAQDSWQAPKVQPAQGSATKLRKGRRE